MSHARGKKRVTSFLKKTYEIVSDESNAGTVDWTADGQGFIIKRVSEFTEEILPRYFKHSNLASFVRQLNMYNFHKGKEDGYENVFRHQYFVRNQSQLLSKIRRKSSELPTEVFLETDCHRLLTKVKELQSQHRTLERTVQVLRDENKDMLEYNRDLLAEVNTYKEREEKLESLLCTFSAQLQAFTELQEPQPLAEFLPDRLSESEDLDQILQTKT